MGYHRSGPLAYAEQGNFRKDTTPHGPWTSTAYLSQTDGQDDSGRKNNDGRRKKKDGRKKKQ